MTGTAHDASNADDEAWYEAVLKPEFDRLDRERKADLQAAEDRLGRAASDRDMRIWAFNAATDLVLLDEDRARILRAAATGRVETFMSMVRRIARNSIEDAVHEIGCLCSAATRDPDCQTDWDVNIQTVLDAAERHLLPLVQRVADGDDSTSLRRALFTEATHEAGDQGPVDDEDVAPPRSATAADPLARPERTGQSPGDPLRDSRGGGRP